jgi:uncharacterized protein (TIGR02246 family)
MHPALRTSVVFLAVVLPLVARAQPQDEAAAKSAIQAIVQDEADAWNRGDAAAFSAHFAPDGSFTNIVGMQSYGRVPFQAQHQRIFSTIYKGSHNEFTIGRIHFIRPDVAVADIDGVLSHMVSVPPDTPLFPDGTMHVKLQLVLSQQNGAWQIDSFHNVTVNPHVTGGPPK